MKAKESSATHTQTTPRNSVVVWIHNDNAAIKELGVIGHYSGMRPSTKQPEAKAGSSSGQADLSVTRFKGYYKRKVDKAAKTITFVKRAPPQVMPPVDNKD